MCEITISLPEEILLALKLSPEKIGGELLLAASIKLFELGKLSSGAAAKLTGIPRIVFLTRLADYGVPSFDLSEREIMQETPLA